jgi:hypothetical protein
MQHLQRFINTTSVMTDSGELCQQKRRRKEETFVEKT